MNKTRDNIEMGNGNDKQLDFYDIFLSQRHKDTEEKDEWEIRLRLA